MNKLVETAKKYLGFSEQNGQYKTIINIYNNINPLPVGYKMRYNDPWCACFVSAMAWAAGVENFPFECSCGRMLTLLTRAGLWVEDDGYTPSPGDLIFYSWKDDSKGDNTRPPDHVGIVEKVENGYITVIEGNYNDMVQRRRIALNGRYIRGFGLTSKLCTNTDNIENIPSWALPTVKKLIDCKALQCDETGKYNLSYDLMRLLVILDRLGKL